ncbi:class 1 fructose-bisphosphatase [Methylotenera sp.]|uniref:class 1 fructose-bisphosphatase n=1 Tax=Methylotenera sp. TaxID=2051956 RepID=UPI00351E2314
MIIHNQENHVTTFINISEFLKHHLQGEHSAALNAILCDVIEACKKIAVAIDKGALTGNMGNLGSENIQGEVQKALDVITDDIFIEACQQSGYIAGMASEELVDVIEIADNNRKNGQYLLLFDPLDGSSNVNVNISVGTIFSILKSSNKKPELSDFLQAGTEQICAGYALYGTSTMLVLTTGNGVNGFTLDVDSNEFLLTHPDMQIAKDTQEFAINMSNYRFWREPVQRYIDECLQGEEGDRKKDFNMRWVASMVAEIHRILIRGGVFMYPTDSKSRSGKLRLMYEANPMSFIVEQAGGASTTGTQRILEVKPSGIHQRVPVMMGSKNEIERIAAYHQAKSKRK